MKASNVVGAFASSHAVALIDSERWEDIYGPNRKAYQARYGHAPKRAWDWSTETLAEAQAAHERFKLAFEQAAQAIRKLEPTVLVVIGGDQDEDLLSFLPQVAVYPAPEFFAEDHLEKRSIHSRYLGHQLLAEQLRNEAVADGFDVATLRSLPDNLIRAHAFGPLLKAMRLPPEVRVVPIYVETLHLPAMTPGRCHALGASLRRAADRWAGHERVVFCASGGLSHFTAGYPYDAMKSDLGYGAIAKEVDAKSMSAIKSGQGESLCASLSNADLIDTGNAEFRTWAVLLGAVGNAVPSQAHYEAIFHAGMGMGVCAWINV